MKGTLTATFRREHGRTTVSEFRPGPPLTANWAWDADGAVLFYTSNQAGVLLGGDELQQEFLVEKAAHAVVTTVSAAKIGHGRNADAFERTRLRVKGDGILEWYPDVQIVYAHANVQQEVRIELDPASRLIFLSSQAVGRLAAGESHDYRRWRQALTVTVGGAPTLIEGWSLEPGAFRKEIDTLMGGHAYAGLACLSGGESEPGRDFEDELVDILESKRSTAGHSEWIGGISRTRGGHVVVRWLASNAPACRSVANEVRTLARRRVLGAGPMDLGKY